MPHFKVELPEGLVLSVNVSGRPVDFKILFPGGKDVHFKLDPGEHPQSSVIVHPRLRQAFEAPTSIKELKLEVVHGDGAGSPQIRYAAAMADGSRHMDP